MTQASGDHWKNSNDDLQSIIDAMSEAARHLVHEIPAWDDHCSVQSPVLLGCDVYSALQTMEHTDDGFPEWTALLVLRTNGHTVTVHDSEQTFTPEVGDILLFNLHREHVLDLPAEAFPANEDIWFEEEHIETLCREYPFVIAHIDMDERPTRAQAEAMFVERLAPALSAGGLRP